MPIGIHARAGELFSNHVMDARKGDCLYIFSDGYPDQFGGPENKKFMAKRMKELLLSIHKKPMDEQKKVLLKTFKDWIDPYGTAQIDDVIVIGVRI
jgi:serine phosphatase RsbU (regulator of sigma subunit)